MKLTKRQLKRIIREEKQRLQELDFSGPATQTDADVYGTPEQAEGPEGETDSLYIQSLGDGTVQITQLNDNAIIEFPINEVRELIDALYEIHEADRQMRGSR
jgi:hypothetical protein